MQISVHFGQLDLHMFQASESHMAKSCLKTTQSILITSLACSSLLIDLFLPFF